MRIYALLFTLFFPSHKVLATTEKAFYRLNIVNQNNELMVVKIANRDLWVTPGLYSGVNDFEIAKLKALAAEYGLTISPPALRGKFQVKPSPEQSFGTRYFYRAMALNEVQKQPEYVELVRWLPLEAALKQINLPHIVYLTRQTELFPEQRWQASIARFQENGQHKIKVTRDFQVMAK